MTTSEGFISNANSKQSDQFQKHSVGRLDLRHAGLTVFGTFGSYGRYRRNETRLYGMSYMAGISWTIRPKMEVEPVYALPVRANFFI
jgi:hypothetical protein